MTATNAWLRMVFKAGPNESYYRVNAHFFVSVAAAAPPGSVYEFIWAEYGSISWVIELILSCTGAVPHCSAGRMDCLIELDGGGGWEGILGCVRVHVCVGLSGSSHKIDTPQCSSDYCRTANCLSNNLPPQPPDTHVLAHTLEEGYGSGSAEAISNSGVGDRTADLLHINFVPAEICSHSVRAD